MTRIVAGAARGRRLEVPPKGTRPTADRAREGLFSTLASMLGASGLRDARFLDLYAGSGAVGLEALSRGAKVVALVERDGHAAKVLARNIDQVGLSGAQVQRRAVEALCGEQNADAPFDVVFADPPYELPNDALAHVLTSLLTGGWLAVAALVVVERSTRGGWVFPDGFDLDRERRYGEATLWYGRAAG